MPFVVDASTSATWVLPDEHSADAAQAYASLKDDFARVPELWWIEIRNVFLKAERKGRIDSIQAERLLLLLGNLPIEVDHTPSSAGVMNLARKHQLSAYDAAYLELAKRTRLSLATLDTALVEAAPKEGVKLLKAH